MKATIVAAIALACVFAANTADAHRYHRCREVSSVVGYEECSRFASRWGLPNWVPSLSLDLGIVAHRFTERIDERGTVKHFGMPYSYRVTGVPEDDRAFTASALALRMTATLRGRWYGGAEEEFGDLGQTPHFATEAAQATALLPTMTTSGGLYMAVRGLFGAQAGVDRLSLAGELAGGVRMIVFDTRSRLMEDSQIDSVLQVRPVLEARVRANYWLSPWIAVGASFGTSIVDSGDVAIGVHVLAHSRTFAGRH